MGAAYVIGLAVPGQVLAGNMALTAPEIAPTPMEITGFSTSAEYVATDSSAGRVVYKAFVFKAPQSPAMPPLARYVSTGRHIQKARFQVLSADGLNVVSEWLLEEVTVSSFTVNNGDADPKSKVPNTFLIPETTFTLQFSKYTYRAFKGDGSYTEMCFDIPENRLC
jgi:type VI protein secretion system component Hcp